MMIFHDETPEETEDKFVKNSQKKKSEKIASEIADNGGGGFEEISGEILRQI